MPYMLSLSVLTDTPLDDLTSSVSNFSIRDFIAEHPYVLLIPVLLIWFGVSFGWRKLQQAYRMQGKPLRPLGVVLKESFSIMFKEDNYPVLQFNANVTEKTAWFTWVFFWKWVALFTVVFVALSILGLISGVVFVASLVSVLLLWLMGIGHVKNVFGIRMHRLTQMFNVASSEARYESGAIVDLFSYIQVQSWADVYHPEQTIVMFPTKYKSEDARNRKSFETNFSGSVTDQNSWAYTWESSQNRVICDPVPFIPNNVSYPFPDENPWDAFPLGLTATGEEAVWNVSQFPHALVAGTTGSGKSVTQRTILLHALQSPRWRVVLVDPKRVELSAYKDHPNVLKFVTELEDSMLLIEQLEQEMHNRYKKMEQEGVNHFQNLSEVPPAILLMVDETFQLLAPSGIKSEEGKAQDAIKARIGILLSNIARLGRASGIHQILATQRPDAKVLPGELKANLDARIAQGRMDTTPSLMTLDSDAATRLPPIKGRAVYRGGGDQQHEFQAYFLAPEYLPEVLDMSAAIAKGETDFLNSPEEVATSVQLVESKSKANPWAKFKLWLESKEAKLQKTAPPSESQIDNYSEVHDVPETSTARSEPDIGKVVAEAAKQDYQHIEPLFVDEKTHPIEPERLHEPVQLPDEDSFDGDPSLDILDDYEELDDEENDFQNLVKSEEWNGVVQGTETRTEHGWEEDEEFDFEDPSSLIDAQQEQEAIPAFTVQDVIARAAERGAPIPASELLAALKAEAAQFETPKPETSRQAPVPPSSADKTLSATPTERQTVKPQELPNVISAPPGQAIPTPPTSNKGTSLDSGKPEKLSDNSKMDESEKSFHSLNPLSAPWIPAEPVEYDESESPFGSGGLARPKGSSKATVDTNTKADKPSNTPKRPQRPGHI